ncbi:MAG: DUF1573 domain-containing protein [Flavobacteriia bacterium]|nr:DUF1573 domain-containing protein [Flavobacteriia bacterium]OIP47136.1 MAG: hypothetical protein AUK46_06275 [Flavobacteriaceae bacterium CG2_30_31_66]PIV96441.1 MAG: hypothetical protein COW43_08425 [Flavobacteriaceae bacterium CG17_big_fil_post_rev_8_21_14_2_50_31_13]PIX14734.1 MAG: hypothetical protein COZ74_02125 [Flavobacteriaceae bacterium CG_4_8_14_3_um_filter_31_8]PIY16399.1 MAG: hypothetical protein COZ16_00170 [Flavobacteriaceae bacterium CG_4_10_14_3_um_filter_31_253]PIZ11404.1 M
MKTIFSFFAILFISISIHSQEFKFETETIDYGSVSLGSNGDKVFVFKNIGNQPLIISNIQSSCGCTVPKKPEKPIMPGEKGEIKVSYDTKRVGGFSKQITIFSNATDPKKVIRIKGIVEQASSLEKEKNMLSNSKS